MNKNKRTKYKSVRLTCLTTSTSNKVFSLVLSKEDKLHSQKLHAIK